MVVEVKNPSVLRHYATSLRRAAADFVKRSRMTPAHTVDGVMEILGKACSSPDYRLLLAVDDRWSLVGFTALALSGSFDSSMIVADVALCYMRPGKGSRTLSYLMNEKIDEVAREAGASMVVMASTRTKDRAWGQYGYLPTATLYTKAL